MEILLGHMGLGIVAFLFLVLLFLLVRYLFIGIVECIVKDVLKDKFGNDYFKLKYIKDDLDTISSKHHDLSRQVTDILQKNMGVK